MCAAATHHRARQRLRNRGVMEVNTRRRARRDTGFAQAVNDRFHTCYDLGRAGVSREGTGVGSTKLARSLAVGAAGAVTLFGGVMATGSQDAAGDQRTLLVTLVTGQTLTVSVDVPPGTPIDQIKIPGVTLPIASVSEVPAAPAGQPPVQVQLQPEPPHHTPAPAGPAPRSPVAAPAKDRAPRRRR